MKKIGSLLLVVVIFCTMLAACARREQHGHIYPPDWVKDETYHWHTCKNPACTEPADKAEHTFGEGETVMPAAKRKDGVRSFTCTVCGYVKTEVIPYVMNHKVADRVYSLLGDEKNGVISASMSTDGMILMLSSHGFDLSLEDDWGDIAIFEYDDVGKMLAIKVGEQRTVISEYDDLGRPTKVGMTTIFTYEKDSVTISPDGVHLYTFDEYGRCIRYEEIHEGYSYVYTLTFDENVGTWTKLNAGAYDDVYTVTYENNSRMVKEVRRRTNGRVDCFYDFKYSEVGLPTDILYIEDPDKADTRGGYHYVYEYNVENYVSKWTAYGVVGAEETKRGEIVYRYDENGRLIEEKELDADGVAHRISTYAYDTAGNLIQREYDDMRGGKSVYEYTYNEKGEKIAEIWTKYEGDALLAKTEEYTEYYENGTRQKRTSIRVDHEEGTHYMTVDEYREDGTRRKETSIAYDAEGKKEREYITEYYANQRPAKETAVRYTEGVEIERTEKLFDEDGNSISV